MDKRPIIIIGFMGSGKSTVARALAGRLNSEMIDLDDQLVKEERRSIMRIFEEDGEPSFRETETRVLRGILQNAGARVIALGGGAWTVQRNRELITEYEGTSVWLDAPFDLCWQRILAAGDKRPLARNEQQARDLYRERRPAYESADLRVRATENKAADEIALEVSRALSIKKSQIEINLEHSIHDGRGVVAALVGDGRPFLIFIGLSLVLSGGFALFLSANQHFLPHDVQFLGLTAEQLCGINSCRVVYFMFHDRVAFGGALISIGSLYMWLAEFPLRQGRAWAWWLFILSGISGFGSFLAYLGYGYLDTWHGMASILLLPFFITGLVRSYAFLQSPKGPRLLLKPGLNVSWLSSYGVGRALLLATAAGMIAGGLTVMVVGMTSVFVPQDLEFMGLQPAELQAISARLVPLIAHDRAGFGGAICTAGIAVFFCVWCARPAKSLWQVLCFSGLVGFAAAIGVHPAVGYTDLVHLAPAILGAIIFVVGLILCYRPMHEPGAQASTPSV